MNIATSYNELYCWLVHVSTDYVFDGTSKVPYKEGDQTKSQGVYGDTKLTGELVIQSSECRHLIIRSAWVFSEYGNDFLKTMLHFGAGLNELCIVGDQIGCPTYAQDISNASVDIRESLKSKELNSGLYHFGGNVCCSWAEFSYANFDEALELKVIVSKPNVVAIAKKEFPTLVKRPTQSQLNSHKITTNFGIESSGCMLGIRLSLTAVKTKRPSLGGFEKIQ